MEDLIGTYVLDFSREDMEDFIETGKIPDSNSEDENLPRRTSRSSEQTSQDTNNTATRRRTASRF